MTSTCWQIDPEEDQLNVPSIEKETIPAAVAETKATESETPTLATNIEGDKLHESSEIAPDAETSAPVPAQAEDAHAERLEEVRKETLLASAQEDELQPVKQSDEPAVVSQASLAPEVAEEEDQTVSTGAAESSPDAVVE